MNLTDDNATEFIKHTFGTFIRFNNILRYLEDYRYPRGEGMIAVQLLLYSFRYRNNGIIENRKEDYNFHIVRDHGILYFDNDGDALQFSIAFGTEEEWSFISIPEIFRLKEIVMR